MNTADEARAEAEKRYPSQWGADLDARVGFRDGAEWQASRKPEAAPSDTDMPTHMRITAILGTDDWLILHDGHEMTNAAELSVRELSAPPLLPSTSQQVHVATVPQRSESVCDICGGHNPVWFAPNEVWNLGGPERPGFECPSCFSKKYQEATGRAIIWRFAPDAPQPVHVEVTEESREKALAEWADKNLDQFVPQPIAGGMRYSFNAGWRAALSAALAGGE